MSYTPIPEQFSGTLWTAGYFNTYLRDNFAASVPDLFTAKGDFAIADGADTAEVLTLGAGTNQYLGTWVTATNKIGWLTPGDAQAAKFLSSTLDLTSTSGIPVTYDGAIYDQDGALSTSGSYVAPADKAGFYLVRATLQILSSTSWTATRSSRLWFGEVNFAQGKRFATVDAVGGHEMFMQITRLVYLTPATGFSLSHIQPGATAITIEAENSIQTQIQACRLYPG